MDKDEKFRFAQTRAGLIADVKRYARETLGAKRLKLYARTVYTDALAAINAAPSVTEARQGHKEACNAVRDLALDLVAIPALVPHGGAHARAAQENSEEIERTLAQVEK